MKDGDVIHEWMDGNGTKMRVKRGEGDGPVDYVFLDIEHFDPRVGGGRWLPMNAVYRTDARELLVAFDKLEAEQNKQRGPLSVEIDGLPGRYLPGLDGQPVRVDGNLEGWA